MTYTKQAAFDLVLNKLREQGVASIRESNNECVYFGDHGRRCAAGWLLPDGVTVKGGGTVTHNDNAELFRSLLEPEHRHDGLLMLQDLQTAHDHILQHAGDDPEKAQLTGRSVERWEERMAEIAGRYGLTYSAAA